VNQVIQNMPSRVYHSGPQASKGRLAILRTQSPQHLLWEMNHPTEPTDAMKLGTAIHTLTLQPELWDREYVVAPSQCEAIKKSDGLRCTSAPSRSFDGKWLCGIHSKGMEGRGDDKRETITEERFAQVKAIRDAVLANKYAAALLSGAAREVSGFWTEDGVDCRMRPDAWQFDHNYLADIKTTADASPAAFQRQLYAQSYDLQAAHYLAGADAVGMPADGFVFIVVEREPPHAVGVYRLADKTLSAVREERRRLLAQYRQCVQSGEFPGYGDQIRDVDVAAWSMKQIETALAEADAAT